MRKEQICSDKALFFSYFFKTSFANFCKRISGKFIHTKVRHCKLIKQSIVVVTFSIVKCKLRVTSFIALVLSNSTGQSLDDSIIIEFTCNVTKLESTKFSTLDCISKVIIECTVTIAKCTFTCFNSAVYYSRSSASPWFTVNKYVLVDCIQFIIDFPHCICFKTTHKVKTESVNMVVVHPVLEGINNVFSCHYMICSKFITTSRTIRISSRLCHAVEVLVYCLVIQRINTSSTCVVVYNVHDYRDSIFMELLNQCSEFFYSLCTIGISLCYITSFWNVVVIWIVTPVI